jgi:hypothetical protein
MSRRERLRGVYELPPRSRRPTCVITSHHYCGTQVCGYSSSKKTLYIVMRANKKTKTMPPASIIEQQLGEQAGEMASEQASEMAIDATLEDSFPASDPPSWTLGVEKTAPNADVSLTRN